MPKPPHPRSFTFTFNTYYRPIDGHSFEDGKEKMGNTQRQRKQSMSDRCIVQNRLELDKWSERFKRKKHTKV